MEAVQTARHPQDANSPSFESVWAILEVREYALNQGLYLIEPAGEELNITPPNGKPKEW